MADATGVAVMGFVALHLTQTAYNAIIMAATTRTDGAIDEIRLDKMAAQEVTELHGKYDEQAYRGNVFTVTMTSGVIFPAPTSTASNPITLTNPAGSGKNVSLILFEMVLTVAIGTPFIGTYGLFVNTNVVAAALSGTALTPIPALVGSNYQSVAKVFTTSTVPAAPTYFRPLVTKEPTPTNPSWLAAIALDFDGTCILSPGTAITPQQTAADTTNATVAIVGSPNCCRGDRPGGSYRRPLPRRCVCWPIAGGHA